jgi:hypothetical protein
LRRILAIDGGGIKGVFPASFLATIEDSIGRPVADYFDLIVGTSTGGIIAIGLGLGYSANDVLALYERHGAAVFGRGRLSGLRGIFRPRYDPRPLREALTEKFGDRTLGESTKRLVVPSLNLETGDVYIFKTAHHERFERDYKVAAVTVAMATAAAPVYFPAHRTAAGTPLVDGGMWANNPTGMAVVEALGVLRWSADDLHVLSLGCTTAPFTMGRGPLDSLGLGRWAFKVADVFMAAQSSASLGTAAVLIGHDRIHRVSPSVANGRFSLDGVREIVSLKGLGDAEARKSLPSLRPVFFREPVEEFVPYSR